MIQYILSKAQKVFDNSFLIVGGITLFGALIRVYHLGFKPLWVDEAVMYLISNGNIRDVVAQNASDNSAPPLFALLLNLVLKLKMGESETVLRLLPWLGGVVAISATYFLAIQFLERMPAYFTTLLVAIAPTQVQFSQQLREYSLVVMTAAIMLALFYRELRHPTWGNWILMTLAFAIGILLQYGLALMVLALNLVFALRLSWAKSNRKALLGKWAISQVIVLGAVGAVYYLSLKQQMVVGFGATSKGGYLAGAYWNGSLSSLYRLAFANTLDIFAFTYPDSLFLFLIGVGLIAALCNRANYIALGMFAMPILVTFVLACMRLYPYHAEKQDIFLTPMIYVIAGFGFSYISNLVKKRRVTLLLVMFICLIGLRTTRWYLSLSGPENIRPVVNALTSSFASGDRIYIYWGAKPAFDYYYRSHIDSQILGVHSTGNLESYFKQIDDILLQKGRVWMVFSHCIDNGCEQIPKYVSGKRQVDLVASGDGAWLYLVYADDR